MDEHHAFADVILYTIADYTNAKDLYNILQKKLGSSTHRNIFNYENIMTYAEVRSYPYIWSFGSTSYCLGHEQTPDSNEPQIITSLSHKGVISVKGGADFSLVLTSECTYSHVNVLFLGQGVYSFGNNQQGQTGHKGYIITTPRLIEALRHEKIIEIAAGIGSTNSLALTGNCIHFTTELLNVTKILEKYIHGEITKVQSYHIS